MAEPLLQPSHPPPLPRPHKPQAGPARAVVPRSLPHHRFGEAELPSQGEKMADASLHRDLCAAPQYALRQRYKGWNVAVHEDMFVHFDQPDGTRGQLAPDLFVALDRPNRPRTSYVVWKEGKPPDFVLEILSVSTWRRDIVEKPNAYQFMGMREHFIFDPYDYIKPRLRGYRLNSAGSYEALDGEATPEGRWGMHSEVLDLHLCHTHPWPDVIHGPDVMHELGELHWYNQTAGCYLETPADTAARADAEKAARLAAEARIAELEAQIRQRH